jgi:hypothetical protein
MPPRMSKISISIDQDVLGQIDQRSAPGGRSTVISRDLDRYYEALRRTRATLQDHFSKADLRWISSNLKSAQNGSIWFQKDLPTARRRKFAKLTMLQHYALVDALERWLRTDPRPPTNKLLD